MQADRLFDEVDGINFEQVADSAPDVILGVNSGMTKDDYSTLSEIAPTIAFPACPHCTRRVQACAGESKLLNIEGIVRVYSLPS